MEKIISTSLFSLQKFEHFNSCVSWWALNRILYNDNVLSCLMSFVGSALWWQCVQWGSSSSSSSDLGLACYPEDPGLILGWCCLLFPCTRTLPTLLQSFQLYNWEMWGNSCSCVSLSKKLHSHYPAYSAVIGTWECWN